MRFKNRAKSAVAAVVLAVSSCGAAAPAYAGYSETCDIVSKRASIIMSVRQITSKTLSQTLRDFEEMSASIIKKADPQDHDYLNTLASLEADMLIDAWSYPKVTSERNIEYAKQIFTDKWDSLCYKTIQGNGKGSV